MIFVTIKLDLYQSILRTFICSCSCYLTECIVSSRLLILYFNTWDFNIISHWKCKSICIPCLLSSCYIRFYFSEATQPFGSQGINQSRTNSVLYGQTSAVTTSNLCTPVTTYRTYVWRFRHRMHTKRVSAVEDVMLRRCDGNVEINDHVVLSSPRVRPDESLRSLNTSELRTQLRSWRLRHHVGHQVTTASASASAILGMGLCVGQNQPGNW